MMRSVMCRAQRCNKEFGHEACTVRHEDATLASAHQHDPRASGNTTLNVQVVALGRRHDDDSAFARSCESLCSREVDVEVGFILVYYRVAAPSVRLEALRKFLPLDLVDVQVMRLFSIRTAFTVYSIPSGRAE